MRIRIRVTLTQIPGCYAIETRISLDEGLGEGATARASDRAPKKWDLPYSWITNRVEPAP